ncbi:lipopolysaccharide biosynthesis protein [Streptococcus plurextorum]|uniref:lipopolysaccharide biosynthesis protein n=1 Tax=Streptococcus plurextorum TaxID=456876 RepID=UPI00040BF7AB|nr:hypothetical protein [Streptococcus plurextorum]
MALKKITLSRVQSGQYVWNLLGTLASAMVSMFFLIVSTRLGTAQQGDEFSFAYTVAQQLYVIGLFGVRAYQSTDMTENTSFQSYVMVRIITITIMYILLACYLLQGHYSIDKLLVIVFMTLYRSCDAFSDVFQGFFQQHWRSDLAGKILFFRNVLSGIVFFMVMKFSQSLLIASLALFVNNFFLIFTLDLTILRRHFGRYNFKQNVHYDEVLRIIQGCFVLCANVFLLNYIFSEPKLVIDRLLENGGGIEGMQRDFNALFMPTFVLNLLILFLRPLLTQLSLYWKNKESVKFRRQVKQVSFVLFCLSLIILLAGYFLGIPILSFVFNIDLYNYQLAFMILLVGGIFNIFATFIDNVMTIYRKQNYLLIANVIAFIVSKVVTGYLVKSHSILGAAVSFLGTMVVYFVTSLIICYFIEREFKKSRSYESTNDYSSL